MLTPVVPTSPVAPTPPVVSIPVVSTPPVAPTPVVVASATPSPVLEPLPEPVAVSDVWSAVSANVNSNGLIDLDAGMLAAFYDINAGDLEEYIAKIPAMNTQVNEIFIARVKSGRMDAVRQSLVRRQEDLLSEYKDYLPDQLELVKHYQLVSSGDYIIFCIGENAAGAISAFQSALA